jgi:hypothetical protein
MAVKRNPVFPAGGSGSLKKEQPGTPITTNITSPQRGFSWGAAPTGPQVQATGSATSPLPGHSGLNGPLPLAPSGRPAALDVPATGAQMNDAFGVDKYNHSLPRGK